MSRKLAAFVVRKLHGRRLPEILERVCEKADRAPALQSLLAELRPVLGGMQPGLVDSVGVGARVSAKTYAFLVSGTWHRGVIIDSRIAPAGVLGRMTEKETEAEIPK